VIDNLLNLARCLAKAGRQEVAIEVYGKAVALNAPLGVHRELAEAYAALGQLEESRKRLATYEQLKAERVRNLGTGQ
jgi:tetratricopeptide (TPR) repeat protein